MKAAGRQKAKAETPLNAIEALRRDLDAADAERADAVRTRLDLEERRPLVVDDGDLDALDAHDAQIERAKRRIDVADSAHARLTLAVQAAEVEAEQARRYAIRAEAETAMAEARRLIADEYPAAARMVAAILNKVAELQTVAHQANNDLPAGAEPVSTIAEPAFNGQHLAGSEDLTEEVTYFVNCETGRRAGGTDCPEMSCNAHRWERRTERVERSMPRTPHKPHRSVVGFTNLPGLDGESYIYGAPFWGQPRTPL